MGRNQDAGTMRVEYINCMGKLLGEHFYELWQELAWLNVKWREYVELYGTMPSRIELLNKAAPQFFRVVQDALWENTLLHLCRLTVPPKSVNKATLTIRALPNLVDGGIKKSVSDLVEIAGQKIQFCRDWRNRHIAHRDLALALKQKTKPLALANRQKVHEALSAIANVLNEIDGHYRDAATSFDHSVSFSGAVQLLYALDDGLRVDAEREERMQRHEFREEDLKPRDL